MDKQGYIHFWKWRVNIIDFLVLIFLIGLLPTTYFAYRILTKIPEMIFPVETIWRVTRPCPICGFAIIINTECLEESCKSDQKGIPLGEPLPTFYETICDRCKNKVVLLKPRVISPPKPPSATQLWYEFLLENKDLMLEKLKE